MTTQSDVRAFVKSTLVLWRINAKENKILGVIEAAKSDPDTMLSFVRGGDSGFIVVHGVTSMKDTSTVLGYMIAVGAVVHEVAHAEFELKKGKSGFLASEKYAYAAELRFYQYLEKKGRLNRDQLELLSEVLEEVSEEVFDKIRKETGSRRVDIVGRLQKKLDKRKATYESRTFESNATGNHAFDFIWQGMYGAWPN